MNIDELASTPKRGAAQRACTASDPRTLPAEEPVHQQEQCLAATYQHAGIAIAELDAEGKLLRANAQWCALTGYSPDEVPGRSIFDETDDEDAEADHKQFQRQVAGELDRYTIEKRIRRKDGSYVWASIISSSVGDANGRFLYAVRVQHDLTERRRTEEALAARIRELTALYRFTDRLHRAGSLEDVYEPALDAITDSLQCSRASILLRDGSGVIRFVASRGLSEPYRRAVDGHSPWGPDVKDAEPICVDDAANAALPESLKRVVLEEGIHAFAFIPLQPAGRLVGKFMAYYDAPHVFTPAEIDLAVTIARQLGFSIERKRAEQTARRFAAVVESSDDAIVSKDLSGIIATFNRGAEQLFGYKAEEVIGKPGTILMPPDRQHEEPEMLKRIRRGVPVHHCETVRRRKDGTLVDVSLSVSPVRDNQGRIVGAAKIARDITERKQTEARLAEREAQLALFVEHAPAAIAMFDAEMRYLAVSRRFVSDFQLPDAEIIGRLHYDIFPDIPPRWREIHARVLEGEELAHEEDPFPRQDGHTDWCRWSMKPWRTAQGLIGGVLLFSEVITEQVEARRALADSEARFRATFENAAVGIAHLAPDLTWLRANEALCRILGYQADELVSKSVEDINHPDDLPACLAHIDHIRDGKIDSFGMDKRYLRKDGSIVWTRLTVGCVRKSDGSIDYFVCMFEDISARKHAEELLRRQADLLDQSHDAIFTWKIGGGIAYWSRGAEILYGYTAEEAIGRNSHELLRTRPPVPTQEIEAQIAREGSWYGELTHTTRDGRTIVVESRHVRVSYDDETYALETNRDITARKQAEKELRKSEERFRSSLLHSPLPILLFDDREQILALSQSWLEQTGYSTGELRCIEDWTNRACGERSCEELKHIRQIISAEPEAHASELRIRTKEGRERLWSFVASALGTQSDGRRLFVSMAHDVTEQKAHEEHVQLLMREVNHRAKNMLSLVQAIARQTATREPEDFIGRFTERIQALAANQDLLVRNEWQGVDVGDLVRAQLAHFADLVGSRIAVQGPTLRLNAAAAQAIGLALHELATNAGKYGALSVDAGDVDIQWRLEGDIFAMTWTEHRGPPVSPPKQRGFGTIVMETMAERSVNGTVDLEYAPSGVAWRLTCPAANALELREHDPNFSGKRGNRTHGPRPTTKVDVGTIA
jgi:PAS domain S-box-containing protein